jgi:hypothetical protein
MQPVRVAMWTPDGAWAGAGATLAAPTPNPMANASAAAPPTLAIVFLVPVIGFSSHFKHVVDK